MGERVVIDRRFHGPPDSAQGGYACGLLAERVASPCVAVSLRLPPPLERPLEVSPGDGAAVLLRDGDRLLAEAVPAELRLELPEPVSLGEAELASARCPWSERHPFPGCFGCGPERSQEEAVAITMGPVQGREGVFAGSLDTAGGVRRRRRRRQPAVRLGRPGLSDRGRRRPHRHLHQRPRASGRPPGGAGPAGAAAYRGGLAARPRGAQAPRRRRDPRSRRRALRLRRRTVDRAARPYGYGGEGRGLGWKESRGHGISAASEPGGRLA